MIEQIKVSHIWGNYFPGLFASPHQYLLEKEWCDTVTFADTLFCNKNFKVKNFYFQFQRDYDELHNENFFGKLRLKIFEKKYWHRYNKWVEHHPAFKNTNIIHAHFGDMGIKMLPLIIKTNLPLVVSFYGVDGSRLLKIKKSINQFQQMFDYTNAVIVLCEEVKNRLISIGLPEKKIKVWRIPVELDIYQYQPRKKTQEVRFIIAARFVEKKGYPFLLQAFHRLIKEGKNVKLTIIGYGNDKFRVENEIKERELEPYIKLIDTKLQNNFPQVYYNELSQTDIFVLPSTTSKHGDDEGGPALTLIAAQASGLPVICTPFPGAEMSVTDNETGIFCAFNSADSLYEKMLYLYSNPPEWNRLGKKASDFVHKNFLFATQMEEVLNIYKEVLESENK